MSTQPRWTDRRVPAWSLVVAVVLLGVALCGWAFSIRPMEPVCGSVGEVVGGVSTALALLFTGVQIRSATLHRQQDKVEFREAMARSVAVSSTADEGTEPGTWRISFTVHNGSQFPLDNPVVLVADVGAEEVDLGRQMGTISERVLSTVVPGETVTDDMEVSFTNGDGPVFGELTGLVSLIFTDAWNQHWLRGPGVLERLDHPARSC